MVQCKDGPPREKLLKMRVEFEVYKERLRLSIAARYEIKRPEGPMVVLK
jgi:hypothetical protein